MLISLGHHREQLMLVYFIHADSAHARFRPLSDDSRQLPLHNRTHARTVAFKLLEAPPTQIEDADVIVSASAHAGQSDSVFCLGEGYFQNIKALTRCRRGT